MLINSLNRINVPKHLSENFLMLMTLNEFIKLNEKRHHFV